MRLEHTGEKVFASSFSSEIGGKTPLKVWSKKVTQDYDSL